MRAVRAREQRDGVRSFDWGCGCARASAARHEEENRKHRDESDNRAQGESSASLSGQRGARAKPFLA
jgi:hypothetical protein